MSSENKLVYSSEACRMICNSKEDNPYAGTMAEAVWKLAHDSCLSCVEACAAADAVEAAHGRWIRKPIGKYTGVDEVCCSICGYFVGVVASDAGFKEAIEGMNYCPNCGVKMDGGV